MSQVIERGRQIRKLRDALACVLQRCEILGTSEERLGPPLTFEMAQDAPRSGYLCIYIDKNMTGNRRLLVFSFCLPNKKINTQICLACSGMKWGSDRCW